MAKETHLFLEKAIDSKTSSVPTVIEVIGKKILIPAENNYQKLNS